MVRTLLGRIFVGLTVFALACMAADDTLSTFQTVRND